MLQKFLPVIDFESYEDMKANYKVNVPEGFNFAYDIVDAWADEDESKNALLWCNDKKDSAGNRGKKMYTFKDMKLLSNKAANLFLSLGIKKGDTVMFMLKQRPEVWIAFLALHKIGAICIPATYQLTSKDIVYRCNVAQVKMVICVDDDYLVNEVINAKEKCNTLELLATVGERNYDGFLDFRKELDKQPEFLDRIKNNTSDPMLIYFSSGTTGMPKMILHDYSYPLGHISTAKYWQQVGENKLHLTMSDSGWAKFAWGKIYGQWICGAVIVAYDNEKFDPKDTLQLIQEIKLHSFCAPPTIFRFFIKEDIAHYDFSSIKHCSMAGEPLNPEVFYKFKELTGLTLTEGFGQTETPVLLANFEGIEIKPGSTGKPSPDYDIDIVDENGKSCEDGIVGSIVIRNLSKHYPCGLIKEYKNDEEANKKAFVNDCYYTGDTAWRDADGYYWFEGRSDDVIKCSGYRIGPFEVESAIMTHPSVLECAVTAAPDAIRGQVVKATIVLTKGHSPSEELKKEIQNHVKKVTAPYKYPRIVEFVSELPKTTSGKIKRASIRENDNK
ncbi:MAG TPA: acetyl-CoA synthetase [Clostridiales bacterium]|nr:AMP-binding protein [Eubacteriales bacterium]HBR30546.1 acetyl-CoA synthetase [Clostridiales bacterium]